jgi:hypothetical protein
MMTAAATGLHAAGLCFSPRIHLSHTLPAPSFHGEDYNERDGRAHNLVFVEKYTVKLGTTQVLLKVSSTTHFGFQQT